MKYLEIIPNFLSVYGVFTYPNTSQVRQEMSISEFEEIGWTWNSLSLRPNNFFLTGVIHACILREIVVDFQLISHTLWHSA